MTIDPSVGPSPSVTMSCRLVGNAASPVSSAAAPALGLPYSSTSSLYQNRTVARPVANLGNTCYINAVLQALAHAPELVLAMDCEPHSVNCPIAASNAVKEQQYRQQQQQQQLRRSRSSSPDIGETGSVSGGAPTQVGLSFGIRKSRRPGRKSPRISELMDSSNHGPNDVGNGLDDGTVSVNGDNSTTLEFCALCEIENHLRQVHDCCFRDKPVAPDNFVNGFFEEVAPWFKLGIQEDSHEFLRLLIDAMQKSCRRARILQQQKEKGESSVDPVLQQEGNDKGIGIVESESSAVQDKDVSAATRNKQKDTEYPFSLFRGTVESKVVCSHCLATSSTLDPIEDVGLEVAFPDLSSPASVTETSSGRPSRSNTPAVANQSVNSADSSSSSLLDVQTAFHRFASTEALDAGYKCEKCGNCGRATKQSRLASIPPILTLHLKRFRYGGTEASGRTSGGAGASSAGSNNAQGGAGSHLPVTRSTRSTRSSEVSQLLGATDYYSSGKSGSSKIEGHIKFDPVFDLRPYLTKELQDQHTNMFCRLFAVIVHAGKNSHSGHYIAYVRNVTKNEWYKMDDARVSAATLQEVLQAEAYMLFYRVVQHPVSVMLEDLHKKKMEATLTASDSAPMTVETTRASNEADENSKKRGVEEIYKEGEEWFRSKTSVPHHLIPGIVRKTENMLADQIQLAPSSSQRIMADLANSSNNKGDNIDSPPQSPCSIITEDDVVGIEKIRRKVVRICYELEEHVNKKAASGRRLKWFETTSTTMGSISRNHNGDYDGAIDHASNNENNDDTIIRSNNRMEIENTKSISNVVVEEADDSVGLL